MPVNVFLCNFLGFISIFLYFYGIWMHIRPRKSSGPPKKRPGASYASLVWGNIRYSPIVPLRSNASFTCRLRAGVPDETPQAELPRSFGICLVEIQWGWISRKPPHDRWFSILCRCGGRISIPHLLALVRTDNTYFSVSHQAVTLRGNGLRSRSSRP